VQRRIFGPERKEVIVGRRKLRNEELHNLNYSQNNIRVIKWRRMRWTGNIACMGYRRSVCKVLVGKLERRDYGRSGSRWENDIGLNLT
jgi:hypothetical protein